MSINTINPDTWQESVEQCREAFSTGGPAKARKVLRDVLDFSEELAELCYIDAQAEIANEFAEEKADPRPKATEFYREMKDDEQASWPARINCQVQIDNWWEVIDRAQTPHAEEDELVRESYAFYHLVLKSDAPSPSRVRARRRLDLLMNGRPRRSRPSPRGPGGGPNAPGKPSSESHFDPRSPKQQLADSWRTENASSSAVNVLPGVDPASLADLPCDIEPVQPKPSIAEEHASSTEASSGLPLPPESEVVRTSDGLLVTDPLNPDEVLTPEMKSAIETALAAADPHADPFMVVMNAYLDVKYPDDSPAVSHPDTAGQSSDTSPHGENVPGSPNVPGWSPDRPREPADPPAPDARAPPRDESA